MFNVTQVLVFTHKTDNMNSAYVIEEFIILNKFYSFSL